ncbi:LPS biosynthesis protein [Flavobacterium antarcticum]|uniref:glycosyltransferase family protein n=1 Tax=Flavobacterium antarcticum TaxID=271155 RepID=UPI00041ABCE8|nr:LPS biosynthesis protein [Flavobacterium antarcticum]
MRNIETFFKKNIIFFSVQTFNLEKEIIKKLTEFGALVEYYDERPSNNNFTKGIIRLKRSFYQHKIDSYYKNILNLSKGKHFDFLFVNKGEVIPVFFLKQFKIDHPACVFIFFTWDSFSNNEYSKSILNYFDRKFSFDPEDAKKYELTFRPLFFLDAYNKIKKTKQLPINYDILFIGTAHSDRYLISSKVMHWARESSLRSFCYYYMHGKLVYFYKKQFDKSFQKFDYSKLSFKSLSTDEILQLYRKSKVILDINHPNQNGLTMRTFESVGAGKKLITTNVEIRKYPFYNPKNIFVIDRDNIKLELSFFTSDYEEIDSEIYDSMSIGGWLKEIFGEKEISFWKN